jgi:hypothetical protein
MIRTATAAFVTAALLAAPAALAQDQGTTTAPGATVPDASPTAAAPPPAQPAAAPQPPAADPAAPAAAAPPAEEAPPPAPPTEESQYLVQALDSVCNPLLQGQDAKAVAKAARYRHNRRDNSLELKLSAGKSLLVTPPTKANPTVCRVAVNFGVDQWRPIVEGLNNWAYAQTPQLTLLYQGYRPMTGITITWAWQYAGPPAKGLAFTANKKADGSPLGRGVDQGLLVYSVR